MEPRELDLNETVTGMARLLRRLVPANVHLKLNLHPEPLCVLADESMLDMMLLNLTVNARDAMPLGGFVVLETSEESPYVRLRVHDTGTGIPPEHLGHIFDPFYTTKEPGKGTGLGLATVFSIVQQHQGTIRVSTEVGSGSTFEILLPRHLDGGHHSPVFMGQ
jgi:signal transduction histidine kinase